MNSSETKKEYLKVVVLLTSGVERKAGKKETLFHVLITTTSNISHTLRDHNRQGAESDLVDPKTKSGAPRWTLNMVLGTMTEGSMEVCTAWRKGVLSSRMVNESEVTRLRTLGRSLAERENLFCWG
jgi:hypothetical protein